MPYTDDLNKFYNDVLRPFLENEFKFHCERADTQKIQNIDERIIKGIYNADIIIADLTTPEIVDESGGKTRTIKHNVAYELGISHTIPQKTLMIVQDFNKVPKEFSDIIKYNILEYNPFPTSFNKDDFKSRINEIIGSNIENPVTRFKPTPEETIPDFLISHLKKELKDTYRDTPKPKPIPKIIFIDLDGTLLDSYSHRINASKKAFRVIFKDVDEEDLQRYYESIYTEHEYFSSILGYNFRYNWFTEDIYWMAYFKYKKGIKDFKSANFEKLYKENTDVGTLIVEAAETFKDEPWYLSYYAKKFLGYLKKLDFKLVLVTEGETGCQTTKLAELGIDHFFPETERFINTPFESLNLLNEALKNNKDKSFQDSIDIIYKEYINMTNDYKQCIYFNTVSEMLRNYSSFKLGVIGDRYNIDLEPYEAIDGKNIFRLAIIHKDSQYNEETKEAINNLRYSNPSNVAYPTMVDNLYDAFKLFSDLHRWEKFSVISEISKPRELDVNQGKEILTKIANAISKIEKREPQNVFIGHGHIIRNYYKDKYGLDYE